MPDTTSRCQRCGTRALAVEWDTDIRRHTVVCLSCGRVQQAIREGEKMPEFRVQDNGARSLAADALDAFNKAARTYLDASARHRVAVETVARLAEEVATAKKLLDAATVKWNAELGGIADPVLASAPKPRPARVASTRTKPVQPERACAVCGTVFAPRFSLARYCSKRCGNWAANHHDELNAANGRPPRPDLAPGYVAARASPPEAIDHSPEAIAVGATA